MASAVQDPDAPDISVVTPSFNMLGYLKRCCASVADQVGAAHEHLVMDGGSKDGTAEWLAAHPTVRGVVEPDRGMYDAVNKGFRRAQGAIVSHLNCDEQYLPGALAFVAAYFRQHPDVDVLFGDALIIRPDGSLIAYRKGIPPIEPLLLSGGGLYLYTCAMFLRRRVIEAGELYDESYKDVGDLEFVVRLMRRGYRVRHTRRFLSVFTMTGFNRGIYGDTSSEGARILRMTPPLVARLSRPLRLAKLAIKAATGAYLHDGPIDYAIYVGEDDTQRTTFLVEKPSFRWRAT